MQYPSSPPPLPLKRPEDQMWADEYCWAWAFNGEDGQIDWGPDAHQAGVDHEREYLNLWMGTILTDEGIVFEDKKNASCIGEKVNVG